MDVYGGSHRGMVLAEAEFGSAAQQKSFMIPGWFGREPTNNMRYTNASLAERQALP